MSDYDQKQWHEPLLELVESTPELLAQRERRRQMQAVQDRWSEALRLLPPFRGPEAEMQAIKDELAAANAQK